jgi:branched-chain amino acid transport system permease protein
MFGEYQSTVELGLLLAVLAYSQQIVLKAGVFSFATVGLAAIGAYTTGALTVQAGVAPAVGVAAGTVAGGVAGAVVGLICFRLRGVYLAIATLAFILALQSLVYVVPGLTGGANGLVGIPAVLSFGLLVTAVAGCSLAMWLVNRSRIGIEFDAIRSDEEAAASLGVHVDRQRILALTISGVLAGLGGTLQAHYNFAVFPGDFGFTLMVAVVSYVILGGIGAWWGALLGTAVLVTLSEVLRAFGDLRPVLNGLVLILVVFFFPQGISGIVHRLLRRWRSRAPGDGRDSDASPIPVLTGGSHGA